MSSKCSVCFHFVGKMPPTYQHWEDMAREVDSSVKLESKDNFLCMRFNSKESAIALSSRVKTEATELSFRMTCPAADSQSPEIWQSVPYQELVKNLEGSQGRHVKLSAQPSVLAQAKRTQTTQV
jgi:hypothetical protein